MYRRQYNIRNIRLMNGRVPENQTIETPFGPWRPHTSVRSRRGVIEQPPIVRPERQPSFTLFVFRQLTNQIYENHPIYRFFDTMEYALNYLSSLVERGRSHDVGLNFEYVDEDGNVLGFRHLNYVSLHNHLVYTRRFGIQDWRNLLQEAVRSIASYRFDGGHFIQSGSDIDIDLSRVRLVFRLHNTSFLRPPEYTNPITELRVGTTAWKVNTASQSARRQGIDQTNLYSKTFQNHDVMSLYPGLIDPSGIPLGKRSFQHDCFYRAMCFALRHELNVILSIENKFPQKYKDIFFNIDAFDNIVNEIMAPQNCGKDPSFPVKINWGIQWFIDKFPHHRYFFLDANFHLLHVFRNAESSRFENNYYFVVHNTHVYVLEKPNWLPKKNVSCCTCFRPNCSEPDTEKFEQGNCTFLNNLPTLINPLAYKVFENNKPLAIQTVNCPSCADAIPLPRNLKHPTPFNTNLSQSQTNRQISHDDCSPHVVYKKDIKPIGYQENDWENSFLNVNLHIEKCLPEPSVWIDSTNEYVWVWDIESMLIKTTIGDVFANRLLDDETNNLPVYTHETNYVKVMRCFTNVNQPITYEFFKLGDFIRWVLGVGDFSTDVNSPGYFRKSKEKHLFLAHNGKGYDNRLLLDEIKKEFLHSVYELDVMYEGNKVLSVQFENVMESKISFRDSLCHLPMALRKLPKVFGIQNASIQVKDKQYKLEKGEFPYMFNTPENQNYVGPVPDISYFELDKMNHFRKQEVLEWHNEMVSSNYVYDFQYELQHYCTLDVVVLKACVELYYQLQYSINKINPWQFVTLASYCSAIFFNIYIPKSITIKPSKKPNGKPIQIFKNKLKILSENEMNFARQAMRGGRTDVRQRYAFGKMKYVDVVSLYPFVQFTKEFPTGKPQTIFYPPIDDINFNDWELYDFKTAILDIDVDVIEFSFHPVLVCNCPSDGFKWLDDEKTTIDCSNKKGKLVAPLFNMRHLTTTGVELFYAIQSGVYVLKKIHRVDRYEPDKSLFTAYYRQFLKIKYEASGFDGNEEEWIRFRNGVFENQGIKLERHNMVKNEGLRFIAKLLLNSLWGKLGQSPEKKEIFMGQHMDQFKNLVAKGDRGMIENARKRKFEINNEEYLEADVTIKDYRQLATKTSYPVAVYVAAWGRIVLWQALNKLGSRVVYHDTDSIIYHYDEDNPAKNIKEGNQLGEWEAEENGEFITEIACVAPKMYAYKVGGREPKIKMKGIHLSVSTDHMITFDLFKKFATNVFIPLKDKSIDQDKFEWLREECQMVTYGFKKIIRGTYDKGIIDKNTFRTYPFGSERFITIN